MKTAGFDLDGRRIKRGDFDKKQRLAQAPAS
jgi:hypothetical protein